MPDRTACLGRATGPGWAVECDRRTTCGHYQPTARFVPGETRHSECMPLRCCVWRDQHEEWRPLLPVAAPADQPDLFAAC